MTLGNFLQGLWPSLTHQQLEENRVHMLMRREAYHHHKRLGRACPFIYFDFQRRDYALLLRAARASGMSIADFLQQAGLAQAHVVMQLKEK